MAGQRLVIANTTPLINFAEMGRLELLRDLFGEIAVPLAVVDELQAKRELFPAAAGVCQAPYVRVHHATDRALVDVLSRELHAGEAEPRHERTGAAAQSRGASCAGLGFCFPRY